MGTSSEQHYSLRWNDYTVKIVTAFQSLKDEEDFVDVTVACDGHHYSAHKMVLSACSPYFRSLLRANPCQHPIVILKDVGHIEMEKLLEFMYNGEVNIAQDQLAAFLKTAESLKIRGLAGSSDDLDQSQNRDPHNSSCFSGGTGTIGGVSGRNSPSGGFNSSQECKDDDITTDGIFHTNSPSTKRRKRASGAPVVSQADNSASQTTDNLTGGEGLMEGSGERVGMSGDPSSIDLEDDRMDGNSRRELKSEPSDSLGEVYVESSDIGTDQSQHSDGIDHRPIIYPLALPGPSGSSSSLNNQDGLSSSDNAAAPQSAVCEALNLSLRPTPAIPQLNGSTAASFPASVSIQRHHHHHHHSTQRSLYPQHTSTTLHYHHHHQTPSNAVTLVAPPPPLPPHPPPVRNRFKREEEDLENDEDEFVENKIDDNSEVVHPEIIVRGGSDPPAPVAIAVPAELSHPQLYAPSESVAAAMDLVCVTEKKPTLVFSAGGEAEFHASHVPAGGAAHGQPITTETVVSVVPTSTPTAAPAFKSSKIYPCQECYKVFRHPMSLHHHRHVHKGTYTCHSCGKVFSRRWDLHRHIHRSKMGCRRPNHHNTSTTTSTPTNSNSTTPNSHHHGGLTSSSGPPLPGPPGGLPGSLRQPPPPPDHPSPYDLNNPPSN